MDLILINIRMGLAKKDASTGQLSYGKLSFLLLLLFIVWALCYIAQLQLPMRHIMNTYNKIQGRNISKQSIQLALNIIRNTPESFQRQKQLYLQKYRINRHVQKKLCVILLQTEENRDPMLMVKSIFQQEYTLYQVYYYIRDEADGKKSQEYLEANAIDPKKLRVILSDSSSSMFDHFLKGQENCGKQDLVIMLTDEDIILGNNAFSLINTLFNENPELNFIYSGSIVKQSEDSYRLGYSYPYPEDIIEMNHFREYPFIAGGIRAFTQQIYTQVKKQHLIQQSTGNYFSFLKSIVFYIKILEQSSPQIFFIQQPLLLDQYQQIYITSIKETKAEIKQLYSQKFIIA